ncbi:ribonuclease H [Kocuria tytonicola]|uniref:Ribonuclease H n=1 Tax=Kocuria tytonicola TaxID=2055946 RepID=A0A3L9M0N8_9MICC|nr:ribonuclease H [Kocuria tytonicola]RLY92179.1 ribonuclease HI [Kocuria tytonicola]RLZ03750.1 ribonuclease H [Kocuria tytonicola]
MTIIASADGSALGNPGPAGWAWYIDPTSWRAGGWAHGTNNMGELTAVLDLLEQTRHRADEPLTVYCDSQYVINSITKWMPGWKKKGWKKRDGKPVMNVDIMKALDRELSGRTVHFEWVKGHAGHELNEAADERARAMATAYQAKKAPGDMPVGPGFRDDAGEEACEGSGEGAGGEARGAQSLTGTSPGPGRRPGSGGGAAGADTPPVSGTTGARPSSEAPENFAVPDEYEVLDRSDASEPDLFSELEALDRVGAGNGSAAGHGEAPDGSTAGAHPWPPHLVAEAVTRETAAVCAPAGPGTEALLHPRMLCVDARGRAGGAPDFAACSSPGATAGDVLLTALGADAYHLSYRLEGDTAVTRRSSVWVRQDQHNEMGPWLLRFHQATAED